MSVAPREVEVVAAAERAIAVGSHSFAQAARLFDPATRASAVQLYAWCRWCDDVVDGQTAGHGARVVPDAAARLAGLRAATLRALDGDGADGPAFAGLAQVARRHGIPREEPLALLDGFALDVANRRYRTLDELLGYCYHVAGVVGIMMARVMGVRAAPVLDRACDLGLALQLTNVARDVAEDVQVGRVYLPLAWLAEEGLAPETLAAAMHSAEVGRLRARLLAAADPYYASARAGLALLPFRSAWAVAAARAVYRDIGRVVRTQPAGRAVVGRGRRLLLVGRGAALAALAPLVARGARRDAALWSRPATGGRADACC